MSSPQTSSPTLHSDPTPINQIVDTGDGSEASIGWIWNTIVQRKTFVFAGLILGLLGGLVASLRHKQYTSTGKIQVRSGSSSMYRMDPSALFSMGGNASSKLQSDVAILTSDTLRLRVARELKLADNLDFMDKKYGSIEDPLVQDHVLERFNSACAVDLVPQSEIISISCTTHSKALSASIVNTLINDYINHIFESRTDASQRVYGWLSVQLNDLKDNVERDQAKLIDYQKRLGVLGSDQTHNIVTESLENLTKAAGEAKMQRIIAEARFRSIQASEPNLVEGGAGILAAPATPTNSQFTLLNTLREDQVKLSKQYAALRAQYGTNYPEVKEVKAQLDETTKAVAQEQDRVLAQYRESYEAARANEAMSAAALEAQKSDAFHRQDDMVNFVILQHQYEANRTLYEGLLQRLREAGIVSGLESSEVDIIDMGRLAGRPNGHGALALIAIGIIGGLFLGIVLAFVADAADSRVRDASEIEAILQLPTLALLPHRDRIPAAAAAGLAAGKVDLIHDPQSIFAEGIRTMRTAILLSGAGGPPQVITFTSSMQGEGKSLVSANAAASLARADSRVLLIDADMRRPTQRVLFGVPARRGLSDVLASGLPLDEAALPVDGVPGLFLMTSGPNPPSPADILSSSQFTRMLDECRAKFTHIIIDSPPGLYLTDPILLAQKSDAVIIVVREGIASRPTLRRIRQIFSQAGARIIGVVLNDITQQGIGYGYYYADSYTSGKK